VELVVIQMSRGMGANYVRVDIDMTAAAGACSSERLAGRLYANICKKLKTLNTTWDPYSGSLEV